MVICIFGDSITYGFRGQGNNSWAECLKNYFEADENQDVKVYNLGICSETTEKLLKRIEVECEARDPEVIVVDVGINDSRFLRSENRQEVSLNEFENNLNELLMKSRKFTNDIVFIGLTDIDESKIKLEEWSGEYSYRKEDIAQYNQILEKFCDRNDTKFIDVSDCLGSDDLADGLHPNSSGHKKIFKKVRGGLGGVVDKHLAKNTNEHI